LGSPLAIVAVTVPPRLGGESQMWANGIYEALCVLLVFPLVVWIGASGETTDALSTRICNFLGDISYPIYIIHFPLIYTCFAYAKRHDTPGCKSDLCERNEVTRLLLHANCHVKSQSTVRPLMHTTGAFLWPFLWPCRRLVCVLPGSCPSVGFSP